MSSTGPSNQSVGVAAPAMALAALALGVIALVAPLPFLRPPPPPAEIDFPLGAVRPPPTVTPIVPEDWSALEEPLSKLREPVNLTEIVQGPETDPETIDPEQVEAPPIFEPLRWRYLGWIQEPDRIAALVVMNELNQRILYEGERVIDEFDPHATPIEVVSITASEIVVQRGEQQERFPVRTTDASVDASALSPLIPRPASTPPPGRSPNRRR